MSVNPLAKLNVAPTYTMILPSTGKSIEYRPFLVSEHKILQLAKQSEDVASYARALSQVISRCTFDAVNPESLSSYDIEVFLLRLRQKSIGESVELLYRCNAEDSENKKCGEKISFQLNLETVSIEPIKKDSNILNLSNDITITIKYPNLANMVEIESLGDEDTVMFISKSIISIASGDELFLSQDLDPDHLLDFVERLSPKQVEKIIDFYENFPSLTHKIDLCCPKCGNKSEITLKGIQDFFRIILSQDTLANYYKSNLVLMTEYGYSLTELDNMMPWEREVYISLLIQHLEKKKDGK